MKRFFSLFFAFSCAVCVLASAPADVQMVDLGLSVKWANMNVGATAPEESGNYFAWGETQGYTGNFDDGGYSLSDGRSFNWASYKWCKGSNSSITKYCTSSSYGYNGFMDGKTVLEAVDDAATVNWGDSWRMPTDAEWEELLTQCTWTEVEVNNIRGFCVSASNGNSIFLPVAGHRSNADLFDPFWSGEYWSASLYYRFAPFNAYCLCFECRDSRVYGGNRVRTAGLSVRPVSPYSTPTELEHADGVNKYVNTPTKLLRDGQVLIQRGDRIYDLRGQEVK